MWAWAEASDRICFAYAASRPVHIRGEVSGGGCVPGPGVRGAAVTLLGTADEGVTSIDGASDPAVRTVRLSIGGGPTLSLPTIAVPGTDIRAFAAMVAGSGGRPARIDVMAADRLLVSSTCASLTYCAVSAPPS